MPTPPTIPAIVAICLLPFSSAWAGAENDRQALEKLSLLARAERWVELGEAARATSESAQKAQAWSLASAAQYMICQSLFQRHQYSRALEAARAGRDYAVRASAWLDAAYNSFGIASVYLASGQVELGRATSQQMMAYLERTGPRRKIEMRNLHAILTGATGDVEGAKALFLESAAEAESAGDYSRLAEAYDRIGYRLLDAGRTGPAEPYLIEAFRLRRLFKTDRLGISYGNLGRLRLAQQDWAGAIRMVDLALRHPSDGMRPEFLYLTRARAHLGEGRPELAFRDLRSAVDLIRALRPQIPFGDEFQTGGENNLHSVYLLFAQVAAELHQRTGQATYLQQSFEAVEENRASSLRLRNDADETWRDRLPEDYWRTLRELRRRQTLELLRPDTGNRMALTALRSRLAEMESSAAVPGFVPFRAVRLGDLQSRLQPGETLISYLLAEPQSLRWTVSRGHIALQRLAGKTEISRQTAAFRELVAHDDASYREAGRRLGSLLVAGVPVTSLWTILPDSTLFELPFGALETPAGRLVDQVAVRLAPAATFLGGAATGHAEDRFLGLGDPVSNLADDRVTGASSSARGIDLPRLPGSAEELVRCARLWPSHEVISGTGLDSTAVHRALDQRPQVLHFATHVYQSRDRETPVITLGYGAGQEWSVLTDREIAVFPHSPQLVTLSGCGSGRGPLAPGSGLLGLTRAWLMAGTQAVLATLWPMADDNGAFFEAYYRTIRAGGAGSPGRTAALALQTAQRQFLAQPEASGRPSAWAGYFLIGAI